MCGASEVQAHEEAAAAASLLFLQQSTQRNPFPPDLPDSDDPVQPILKRHLLVVREEGEAGVSVKEGKSDGRCVSVDASIFHSNDFSDND
jgi:hypothetical protein